MAIVGPSHSFTAILFYSFKTKKYAPKNNSARIFRK